MCKCCASQDGVCNNAILYGTQCDGCKEKCKLRNSYKGIETAIKDISIQSEKRSAWRNDV